MIVPLKRVTFIGLASEKERFLKRLQEVGVTMLILPKEAAEPTEVAKELQRVTEARKFLARQAKKIKAEKAAADYLAICLKREELGQEEAKLQTELAALKKERALLELFGEFKPQDLGLLAEKGLKIQFFRASRKLFESLPLANVVHQVASQEGPEVAFVTFAWEPVELGLVEEKLPNRSLSETEALIEQKEKALEAIQEEYLSLARQRGALLKAEAELTDKLEYRRALLNAASELEDRLFAVSCWSPVPEDELLRQIGPDFTLAHFAEEPDEEEKVPALMVNKPAFEPGTDLVKIYDIPSYRDFDPSPLVLWCFAIFFGMIIGDAGYGLCLLGISFLLKLKVKDPSPLVKRLIRLSFMLSGMTVFFGVISVSYFGVQVRPEHWLNKTLLLDFNTKEGQNQVMLLSILMGMTHLSIALFIKFYRQRHLASLGWIIAIWSGYLVIKAKMGGGVSLPYAKYIFIAGLLMVIAFSSSSKKPLFRIMGGLNGLLGIVQLFSDILSYLRLFALGIATVFMCQTFNNLAENIAGHIPYVGFIAAVIILLMGHTINLALGVMGGFIHGLRLNFLEWYRWCFEGDGVLFKPYRQISKGT